MLRMEFIITTPVVLRRRQMRWNVVQFKSEVSADIDHV